MQTLEQLFSDSERERELLEGSHLVGARFQDWEEHRRLIAQAIHRPGTLLDIGCANGLLLRCLLEWSQHPIVPYGIEPDPNPKQLAQARELMPQFADHFAPVSLGKVEQADLPRSFDFVYWCVWDDFGFDWEVGPRFFENAYGLCSQRLILGFYGPSPEAIAIKIKWLEGKLGKPVGYAENPRACVVVTWWDKLH